MWIAPQMMFDANAFVAAEIAVHFALKRATLVQKRKTSSQLKAVIAPRIKGR